MKPTAVCSGRWTCPACGLQGQVWQGHEDETSLAVHQKWLHPTENEGGVS